MVFTIGDGSVLIDDKKDKIEEERKKYFGGNKTPFQSGISHPLNSLPRDTFLVRKINGKNLKITTDGYQVGFLKDLTNKLYL